MYRQCTNDTTHTGTNTEILQDSQNDMHSSVHALLYKSQRRRMYRQCTNDTTHTGTNTEILQDSQNVQLQ